MSKAIGVVLLVVGLMVAIYGFNRQNSLESQLAGVFGQRDNGAIICIIIGAIAMIGGAVMLLPKKR